MTSEMTSVKAWERQPNETSKSWNAFQLYIAMPPMGETGERRSLENVAKSLGLKSMTGVQEWSAKYHWVERTIAYDNYMGSRVIHVKETALEQYQQSVITSMSEQLAIMNKLINRKLTILNEAMASDVEIPALELLKLMHVLEKKDDLARRIGAMPTGYNTERVSDPASEDTVYLIGGE